MSFSSGAEAADPLFSSWSEMLCDLVTPMRIARSGDGALDGSVYHESFGELGVFVPRIRSRGASWFTFQRRQAEIARTRQRRLFLMVWLGGENHLTVDRKSIVLRRHDWFLINSENRFLDQVEHGLHNALV